MLLLLNTGFNEGGREFNRSLRPSYVLLLQIAELILWLLLLLRLILLIFKWIIFCLLFVVKEE